MRRSIPQALLVALIACVSLAPAAFAGARCSDDPESCVKGASRVSRPAVELASATSHTPATVQIAPGTPAPAPLFKAPAPVPSAKKAAARPQRTTPRTTTPTPGMGLLLKMSNGGGGDISWLPGKNNEATSPSWVL